MKKSSDKVFVIQGEASESEDDEKVVLSVVQRKEKLPKHLVNKGVIVAGEASESESESEDAFRQAFFAKSGATENHIIDEGDHQDPLQYDTLLHKKLRECNVSLYNNVSNHSRQNLLNGIKALNTINQQLLVTQIQVQDSASSLSKAFDNIAKLDEKLNSVLATPYIPEINIL